jgi:hypothetical protein
MSWTEKKREATNQRRETIYEFVKANPGNTARGIAGTLRTLGKGAWSPREVGAVMGQDPRFESDRSDRNVYTYRVKEGR